MVNIRKVRLATKLDLEVLRFRVPTRYETSREIPGSMLAAGDILAQR